MTAGRAARRLAPFAVQHHPNRGRTLQWPVGRTCEGVESMHVENICSNTPRAMHLSRFMRPQVRPGPATFERGKKAGRVEKGQIPRTPSPNLRVGRRPTDLVRGALDT